MECCWVSSLEKVFPDEAPQPLRTATATALCGERFSVQCATCHDELDKVDVTVSVVTDFPGTIRLYRVGYVPVLLPAYSHSDDYFLRKTAGVYPDPLFPPEPVLSLGRRQQWRSLWVEWDVPADCPAGTYTLELQFEPARDWYSFHETATFSLEVIPAVLPPQTLLRTDWFHCDCLAVQYGVPVFSAAHWTLMENYIREAVVYGQNTLLVPLFTPPLDTAVGGERPTVQLVEVSVTQGRYRFSFRRLRRFLRMAAACGITCFEMSHLFTQWGAAHAPKIIATVDGKEAKLFGWDTDASGREYQAFVTVFLKRLVAFLRREGVLECCRFHVSDEPNDTVEDTYRVAAACVNAVIPALPVMDALSHYSFYEKGLVRHPVPSIDHADAFLENGVPDLWLYYCCSQTNKVSNRMIAMPSARNRILGVQLYRYDIKGFLQWGFNFWFSQYSRRPIDPYLVTDADDAFPAGDAFIVYPGQDGKPVPSLRQLVFNEGLQDMRALQLLESLTSRGETLDFIAAQCGGSLLTLTEYPRDAAWLLAFRAALNEKIKSLL